MKGRMKRSFDQYEKKAIQLEAGYSKLIDSIQLKSIENKDEI